MQNITVSALALASTVTGALILDTRVSAAPPEDQRTFLVTVEGDDGVPETGTATATLVKLDGDVAIYSLTRKIVVGKIDSESATTSGAALPDAESTAAYNTGSATVNEKTHSVHVTFAEVTSPGLVNALGAGAHAPATTSEAKLSLTPTHPSEYVFEGTWTAHGHTYHETWKEITRLTSDIKIVTPTESGSFGPVVRFEAKVARASRVVFELDGVPIDVFHAAGDHVASLRVWQSGWRRFVVKAYGPSTHGHAGPLIGEAETMFLVKGLLLSPVHGSKLSKERIRVEAVPMGLGDVATVELRLDGKAVIQIHSAPWGADMSLGADGKHELSAVAYGPDGKELAHTHSEVTLDTGGTTPDQLPLPATHETQLPELKGKPVITNVPANPRNYQASGQRTIDLIVIHKAEGSLESCVTWFQNPAARVSAHYCCSDTETAQMVQDQNVCWHTGNRAYNLRSIGIENAGFTDKDDFTDAHYQRLAQLVAWLCKKHGIPLDRTHVIGHHEVPNPNWPSRGPRFGGAGGHTDPGTFFDWNKLMSLAQQAATSM
jgi:N-acetyl-anhydromuramyl-L-alanine amidase AmpD